MLITFVEIRTGWDCFSVTVFCWGNQDFQHLARALMTLLFGFSKVGGPPCSHALSPPAFLSQALERTWCHPSVEWKLILKCQPCAKRISCFLTGPGCDIHTDRGTFCVICLDTSIGPNLWRSLFEKQASQAGHPRCLCLCPLKKIGPCISRRKLKSAWDGETVRVQSTNGQMIKNFTQALW